MGTGKGKIKRLFLQRGKEKKIVKNPNYTASNKTEQERLVIQAKKNASFDRILLNRALDNLDLSRRTMIIDLGCSRGDLTMELFGNSLPGGNTLLEENSTSKKEEEEREKIASLNVTKILGLELEEDAVIDANKKFGNDNIEFIQYDADDNHAKDNFLKVIKKAKENNCEQIVVFTAFALMHMKDPAKVIRMIGNILPPDSLIISRSIDDTTARLIPDDDKRIDFIMRMSKLDPWESDRTHGAKQGNHFRRNEYDIVYSKYPEARPSNEKTLNDKQKALRVSLGWRADNWKEIMGQGLLPINGVHEEDVIKLENIIKSVEEDVLSGKVNYIPPRLVGLVAKVR